MQYQTIVSALKLKGKFQKFKKVLLRNISHFETDKIFEEFLIS